MKFDYNYWTEKSCSFRDFVGSQPEYEETGWDEEDEAKGIRWLITKDEKKRLKQLGYSAERIKIITSKMPRS